jgi:diacylglycerol kinase family enzyme
MDLWLFEGEHLGDVVQLVWRVLAGEHTHSEKVTHIEFQQLCFRSSTRLYVQLDGEPASGNGDVTITVQPRALKVLVPPGVPRPLFAD